MVVRVGLVKMPEEQLEAIVLSFRRTNQMTGMEQSISMPVYDAPAKIKKLQEV